MEQLINNHVPVLLNEVLSFVPKGKNLIYLDMTIGRAGHALAILNKYKNISTLIGVDKDNSAIEYCQEKLKDLSNLYLFNTSYSLIFDILKNAGINQADLILMDIGVSSPQFDDPERGFSYRFDSKLDMRMDKKQKLTAKTILNTYSKEELERVFSQLGECREYKKVVKNILDYRKKKEIETTLEFVDLIKSSLSEKELKKKGHPAKQFFLGLRYEVNDEINELKKGVDQAIKFLSKNGRLIVISFNSEEDKIVKTTFNKYSLKKHIDKFNDKEVSEYTILTKKPIFPSEEEISKNNRAKSSILRVIERR